MEEWRDIPGYEGVFQVSNHGRVNFDTEEEARDAYIKALSDHGINNRYTESWQK
jgi:hypothetical protein